MIISAHQEWLPNLATEMADRQDPSDPEESGWSAAVTESRLSGSVSPEELSGTDADHAAPKPSQKAPDNQTASIAKPIRLAQANQQVQSKNAPGGAVAKSWWVDADGNVIKGSKTQAEPAKAKAAQPEATIEKAETETVQPDGGKETPPPAGEQPGNKATDQNDELLTTTEAEPRASKAAANGAEPTAQPEAPAAKPDTANAKPDGGKETVTAAEQPRTNATDQNDDLLFPDGGAPEAANSKEPSSDGGAGGAPASANAASDAAPADAAPAPSAGTPAAESPRRPRP